MVAATINDNPDIPDFLRRFNPGFPIGEANHLGAYEYMQMRLADRAFVPFMVFIDRKGMIRSQYTGTDPIMNTTQSESLLRAEALKYLNEAAAPARSKAAHKATTSSSRGS